MTSAELELEIKQFIVETLDLEEVDAVSIPSDEALFGDGLGLDSVDALELGIALKKRYGIAVDPKSDETRKHFESVRSLAALVSSSRAASA